MEIKTGIKKLFRVNFYIFSKVDVNGPETHFVYRFLRYQSELMNQKKKTMKQIPWNFAKFLINDKGEIVKYFSPLVDL